MTSVSARVPTSLEEELDKFMEDEKLDKSTAVRKLLAEGLEEWKKEKALEMLEEGEASLSRAAEIANMTIWEFSDLVKKSKTTWIDDIHVQEDLEAV